jgi:hypothetical protein
MHWVMILLIVLLKEFGRILHEIKSILCGKTSKMEIYEKYLYTNSHSL